MSLEKKLEQLGKQKYEFNPPEGHEKRFVARLRKRKRSFRLDWNAAAIALVLLGFGIISWERETPLDNELEVSRRFYTQAIQGRLVHLEQNIPAQHSQSLSDAKEQLAVLHQDYLFLHSQLKEEPSHPQIFKALINNLQQQLNLLQSLEKNINAVEKNDYENIF